MHRVNISLYDAQFDKKGARISLPPSTIKSVVSSILRFQTTCSELGVSPYNIRIVATEATRMAVNSKQFVHAIQSTTGIRVELLNKEEEGKIGAWGIASGFSDIEGLAIDLGGGSMQITWIISRAGNIHISSRGSFSFPYGAAALTKKLSDMKRGKSKEEAKKALEEFQQQMKDNLLDAYQHLEIPDELVAKAKRDGGFNIYLSGGGFRGWGYLLLYLNQTHGRHYPISIINGYSAHRDEFQKTHIVEDIARASHKIFRVSDRRRKQVPSIALLVKVLAETIPHGIKEAHFCQGGVREGVIFQELLPVVRQQDPLEVGTGIYSRPSAEAMGFLMLASIPDRSLGSKMGFPERISVHVVHAFANALFVHSNMSKESSSAAAIYSTSIGTLSAIHGVSHYDRALLALMLEERYQGELPPRESDFKHQLRDILSAEEVWWTRYLGKVGLVIASLYPAGTIDTAKPRVLLSARWAADLGKAKTKEGLELKFSIQKVKSDPFMLLETLTDHAHYIRKVGKRKNWIGGRYGWGIKVRVTLEEKDLI